MSPMATAPNTSKRRLFLGAGLEYFQIFSVSQNESDSSIYFAAPQFENIQWHLPALNENHLPILISYQIGEPGKLSLHGSGVVHAKAFGVAGSNEFAVRGNMLRSQDGMVLSARHLLTVFSSEPWQKPNSPAGARKADELITTKQWHPYVLIFWAVPLTRSFTVQVSGSFHIDDLEEVPPNGGWGAFSLATHAVVWFAYRTKHMNRWPRNTQACYSDGHTVPLFVGTGVGELRLEYRQPVYTLNEGQLSITL